MAKPIMIQGTMSNAGKSLLAAGLCRVLKQDGYRVAPFKSQNMALNSYITSEGLEMGRAQVVQAQAAGCEPSVDMNPILLKPSSDVGSQVLVRGVPIGTMPAKEYFKYKKQLIPEIKKAFQHLSEQYDIIVIEGAGSPAEINLKADDIVNMGLAELVDAPVLLAGVNKEAISSQVSATVYTFFATYLVCIFVGWTLLMCFGVGLTEAMSTVVSAIGNVGPGLGAFGPVFSWAALPDAAKWILSVLMFIGRLEIFGILLLFYRGFWEDN